MRQRDDQRDYGGFAEAQRRELASLRLQEGRVPRPSLVRKLDRLTPFMRVGALPGTGRTTLLADWAMHRMDLGDHVLWVSAHAGLNSRDAFDQHIADIARDVVTSRSGDALPQICAAHPHNRVIVIVDDGDHLTDLALREWLVELCRSHPTLHIVGASNELGPLFEDPANTHLTFTLLTGHDLMVTAAEAPTFARAWGLPLADEDVTAVVDATGGWMGLLREVLNSDHGGAAAATSADSAQAVRRFRDTVSLSVSTASLFAAMSAVALLGSVTSSLLAHLEATCSEILREIGVDTNSSFAEILIDSGLLRTVVDPAEGQDFAAQPAPAVDVGHDGASRARSETFLSVPSALKTVLADEFASRHPVRSRHLHIAAAAYFEATGCPKNLIRSALHARRANDWPFLTRLAARHGWWFGARYGKETADAYGTVTDEAALSHPVLLMTRALAHALPPSTIEPEPRSPMVQRVFARMGEAPVHRVLEATDPNERAFLVIAMVNALRQRGDADGALRVGDELRPSMTRLWDDVSAVNRTLFYLQTGLAAMEVGDLPRAVRRFTRSYEESGGSQSQFIACSAAAHNALLFAFEGRRDAARYWAQRVEDGVASQPWIERVVRLPVMLAHAHLALDESDTARVGALLGDAGQLTGIVGAWPMLIDVHARLALAVGTPVVTLDAIEHDAQMHRAGKPPGVLATALVTRARCALLLADGELTRAQQLIDRTLAPEDPTSSTEVPQFVGRLLSVVQARLWLIAGRYEQARQEVGSSLAQSPTRRQTIDMLVIDAVAALALGQDVDAARSIGRVVSMTPLGELTAAMRAVDSVTRRKLLTLVNGARRDALPGPDDPLYTSPAMYPTRADLIELTEREASVLRDLAGGASLAEIARSDVLSINTVKKQAGSLYRKLSVDNRADALRIAYEQGLLD